MDDIVWVFYGLHYPFQSPPQKEGKQKVLCFTEPYEKKVQHVFSGTQPFNALVKKKGLCTIYTYLHIILKYVNVRAI